MIPSIPSLAEFDVSPRHGFLPDQLPLDQLPDPYYAPWERIIRNLQPLILSRRIRGVVDSLPVLSTDLLRSEPEWRRAYSILGFITHAYVWGGDVAVEVRDVQ
jgi:indoleamine 2,3-dioxygenase